MPSRVHPWDGPSRRNELDGSAGVPDEFDDVVELVEDQRERAWIGGKAGESMVSNPIQHCVEGDEVAALLNERPWMSRRRRANSINSRRSRYRMAQSSSSEVTDEIRQSLPELGGLPRRRSAPDPSPCSTNLRIQRRRIGPDPADEMHAAGDRLIGTSAAFSFP